MTSCKENLLFLETRGFAKMVEEGFGSIYEYAARLASLNCSQVDDALWILCEIGNKPALREAAAIKGPNAFNLMEEFLDMKARELAPNLLQRPFCL